MITDIPALTARHIQLFASLHQVLQPAFSCQLRTLSEIIAGVWFLYLICYGALPLMWSSSIYHLFTEVLAPCPSFWLLIIITPVACVLPSFLFQEIYR